MPLPRRGRGTLLAAPRMASTSPSRATAHSPRRVGRGTPLSSPAQRLTRQRHSSEQVPPGPEPQADFRSKRWLQKGSGGDAGDSRQTPCAGMGSRHRSVPAVPLGRAVLTSCTVLSAQCATARAYRSASSPPRPGPLGTDLLATVPFRKAPAGGWTRPQGWARDGASCDWSVAVSLSRLSATRPILKEWKGSGGKGPATFERFAGFFFFLNKKIMAAFPEDCFGC